MALRAERKANGAPGPRVEVLQPDEQPRAPAGAAVPLSSGRDAAGRIRSTAAAQALARLPRRGAVLPRVIACDPRFEVHQRSRREWLIKRRTELAEATGGVSHGVGAMLNAAAWMYAGAEFAAEQAAQSGDAEGFKLAANLSATARQHDLAAWELACREGEARRSATSADAPWMSKGDG